MPLLRIDGYKLIVDTKEGLKGKCRIVLRTTLDLETNDNRTEPCEDVDIPLDDVTQLAALVDILRNESDLCWDTSGRILQNVSQDTKGSSGRRRSPPRPSSRLPM